MTTSSLTEEFNRSAASFEQKGLTSLSMLLTKYHLLQRHILTDPVEKAQLAGMLFECGLNRLKDYANGLGTPDDNFCTQTGKILGTLLEPESVNSIPDNAPDLLARVALDIIRSAEKAERSDFDHHYDQWQACRTGKSQLAALALDYADKYREQAPQPGNVSTSQKVTPARPIVLKTPAASA